ncbi:MAG: hypothetical protein ACSHYC_15825 [Alphaproteobacteria bacterium]
MTDISHLLKIDNLTDEQAKALAAVIQSSTPTESNGSSGIGFSWMMGLMTVVIGVSVVALLWLFQSYSSLGERVVKIEEGNKAILEALENKSASE